ncbi:MAG: HAMP domain-containing histidine kinase, partial [Bdellovibrionales bacterium]|nr:HAMP domain-containing histidine kinase [Bdellovibrionales bacterium]
MVSTVTWSRLIITGITLHIVILLLHSWSGIHFLSDSSRQFEQQQQQELAGLVLELSKLSFDGDPDTQRTLLQTIAARPGISTASLLSHSGKVVASSHSLKRTVLSIRNIRRFLSSQPTEFPVFGDDPTSLTGTTLFSAAPVSSRGADGFLYVTLNSSHSQPLIQSLQTDYIKKTFLNGALLQTALFLLSCCIIFYGWKRMGRQTSRLIENVSHDIRGPLGTARLYLETLQEEEGTLSAHQRSEYLNVALEKLNRVTSQIETILDTSLQPSIPHKTQVNLTEVCQETMSHFLEAAKKKKISLTLTSDIEGAQVFADSSLLAQAISNLLENALRYTPEYGKVRMSVIKKNGGYLVSISDTGCGIPEIEQKHIFHRFYRGERAKKISRGGTGIGLSLVKQVIEAHDSTMSVTSSP